MQQIEKVFIRGIGVYPFDSEEMLMDYVTEHRGLLIALNAEKILHSKEQMKAIINRNIAYCDGAGVQLALQRKGYHKAQKIAGCELWLKLIERFHEDKSIYLLGAKQETIGQTVAQLKQDFPKINIVGWRNGYFRDEAEQESVMQELIKLKPDIVFVAMGSPKQELFMEQLMRELPDTIFQGLGGSFDVYTGQVKRAPQWWIDHKLEFAYRLIKEPKRIKRQIHLIKYFWWLITNKL